ncbi:MAG TPA: CBS domain-containing protein [Nitrospira sp.]|nr:CBS domain-containing protein [Nitrospira sp.]
MPKRSKATSTGGPTLDRQIEQFQDILRSFPALFSRRRAAGLLDEFDEEAEDLIGQVFGVLSNEIEAYHYAKLGETALLPEEAQESGAHDTERESLHQRKQVLESCLAQLTLRRASREFDRGKRGSDQLNGKKVADFMCPDVRSVHRSASIKEAGRLLQKWKVGSLLVDDGSRYIGIITDTDLSRKAVAKGLDPNTTTVMSCMTKPVVTIEDSEALSEAASLMKKNSIRHLPVTEDGTIIGVLSVADLLRAYE